MPNSAVEAPGRVPARYQIRIKGKIRQDWSDWFNRMDITTEEGNEGSQVTLLTGPVIDQSALRGILCKIWDLNLTILSVLQIEIDPREKEGEK